MPGVNFPILNKCFFELSMQSKDEPGVKPSSEQLISETLSDEEQLYLGNGTLIGIIKSIFMALVTGCVKTFDVWCAYDPSILEERKKIADEISLLGIDYGDQNALSDALAKLSCGELNFLKDVLSRFKIACTGKFNSFHNDTLEPTKEGYKEEIFICENPLLKYKLVARKYGIYLKYSDGTLEKEVQLMSASQFATFCINAERKEDNRYITSPYFIDLTLSDLDLSGFRLFNANLINATLTDINLQETKLNDADLEWATINNANLQGTDFSGTNLNDATLTNVDLLGAIFSHTTQLIGTKIQLALPNWTEKTLKQYFSSDENASGRISNILTTIHSIPNVEIKNSLMGQVAKSLLGLKQSNASEESIDSFVLLPTGRGLSESNARLRSALTSDKWVSFDDFFALNDAPESSPYGNKRLQDSFLLDDKITSLPILKQKNEAIKSTLLSFFGKNSEYLKNAEVSNLYMTLNFQEKGDLQDDVIDQFTDADDPSDTL